MTNPTASYLGATRVSHPDSGHTDRPNPRSDFRLCHIIGGMSLVSWKTRLRRLPANIVSNRFWILWGGSLYVRTDSPVVAQSDHSAGAVRAALGNSKTFVKWSSWARTRGISAARVGLFPTELGMFGNMIRRMGNAILVAQAFEVGHLVVPKGVIFYRGLLAEALATTRGGLRVWFGVQPRMVHNQIDALVTTDFFLSFPHIESLSEKSVDDAWGSLRNLLVPRVPTSSSGDNVLTIHVRGGDVFGPRKPAGYGQPPFSYYQLILESQKWERVDLVYQDMSNPVVRLIMDYCRAHKLPLETQSSDLPTDLTTLLGAENLVAGRGSFIPAVVGLSPHCKNVFYFEDKMNVIPSVSGINFFQVRDATGDYRSHVLSNNWENSSEQRQLMTTYPLSSLVMEGP